MVYAPGTNTGHGHVWERPDGLKARCGGPNLCRECSADMPPLDLTAARKNARTDDDASAIAQAQERIAELEAALEAAALTYAALERNRQHLVDALQAKGFHASWLTAEIEKAAKIRAALGKEPAR